MDAIAWLMINAGSARKMATVNWMKKTKTVGSNDFYW